ncbi:MAG TPA: glycerol-3-phosphate 1-O-acyltransferase PlsY [Caulobacteraceae bacterium]|jgi:glycerol-3-phosphate acyltransferase PlsY|nr:glycerol-3-phosphate 1-O-acyltransferase PlsY [Caulobacteraceae bacterium]
MWGLSPAFIAAALVGGYLLGSIPFGVIATRLGGAGDLRQIGSGSIGATNVLRTGRWDLAAITLLGDGGKGAVAALTAYFVARAQAPDSALTAAALAGGAAFVGHLFPVWLKFRGGKGVATFFGVLLAVAWPVLLLAGATWLAMAALFRMSSLAGLTAAALAPLFAFAVHAGYPVIVLAAFMAVLIFIRHRGNIERLLRGEEPRIGAGRKPPGPDEALGHNGGPPMAGA